MKKILVANRGEIAVRVMQTAHRMGISTVAVYSEADANMPFVQLADEAVLLGKAASSDSYLNQEKIIQTALERKADAIHPGYGFLSENAAFAEKVQQAGLVFIGPPASAIAQMGSKVAAKQLAQKHRIPMVPGLDRPLVSKEEALQLAGEMGYPVLIKASAGGGGKGMRIVHSQDEMREQFDRAVSEATTSFGDGAVFIEKYITSSHHIEIQILLDAHGNGVHLHERECSIQRRHQKVVEEAPSCLITPEKRAEMGADAVRIAQACSYVGAGTVEFLVDDALNHYFLEVNTRLQVEHPVSELITGLDLVEQQIRVARGEALAFTQAQVPLHGHAIELRVYAEDAMQGFLPSIGSLNVYRPPVGEGIRVDDGYAEGLTVPIHYDSMLSKLITYGETREQAIQRMIAAIQSYRIEGVATTLPFGLFCMQHPVFQSGIYTTKFIEQYFTEETIRQWFQERSKLVAALAKGLHEEKTALLVI